MSQAPTYAPHADIDAGIEVLGPELAATVFGKIGMVICRRAQALSVMTHEKAFGIVALALPCDGIEQRYGVYVGLSADRMRRIAAQMLAAADHLDGGRGKQ